MNHYEAINDVLVNLFNEILDLEERALMRWVSGNRKICQQ